MLPILAIAGNGKLIFAKGEVLVNGKRAKKNLVLKVSDHIVTKKNSIAIVKFSNFTSKLLSNSDLIIKAIDVKNNKFRLVSNTGSLFFDVTKKKKNDFQVRIKSVVMGVRGTTFFSGQEKGKVWTCVNQGLVKVSSGKKNYMVKEGEGVSADDKGVSMPAFLPWTKKLNWNFNPDKGELNSEHSISENYQDFLDNDYD